MVVKAAPADLRIVRYAQLTLSSVRTAEGV
jgi:hypothetical protein